MVTNEMQYHTYADLSLLPFPLPISLFISFLMSLFKNAYTKGFTAEFRTRSRMSNWLALADTWQENVIQRTKQLTTT